MEVIFKTNNIATIGGTTPQRSDVRIVGTIGDWVVADVADTALSSIQEFNVQPVSEGFGAAITGPQTEGAYNAPMFEVNTFGSKMPIERNPGQVVVGGVFGVEDGTPITTPDERDDRSKKNATSEDIKAYQSASAFIKKYDAKSVLRNQIRGNIVDIEDDLADTKVASQMALYYFAHEWQTRTQAQKDANPAKDSMEVLAAKLLSDDVKMRGDLKDGIEAINEIIDKEETINKFVAENYSYNAQRGA